MKPSRSQALAQESVFKSASDRLRTAARFWRLAGREAFADDLEAEALEAEQADATRGPLAALDGAAM
jgi:hypothetical protein